MPTPCGRRHCPRHSGYFESSAACAANVTAASAAARASEAIRRDMDILHDAGSPHVGAAVLVLTLSAHSPLRLREIAQVRRRLILAGRHQEAVRADHVVVL